MAKFESSSVGVRIKAVRTAIFLRQVSKTRLTPTGRLHQTAGMMGLLGLITVQTSTSDSRVGDNATNARSPGLIHGV